jgi:hypothetical protein
MSFAHHTHTASALATNASTTPLSAGLSRLFDEARTLAIALLSPGSVISEVEAMSALHRRASAVEATDPDLAAQLRKQASRIGLR